MGESQARRGANQLTWVAKESLVRNPVFVRQMALVLIIPLMVLGLIMCIISWPPSGETLGMLLRVVGITGGILLALTLFVVFVVLGGRQQTRYTLDEQGIRAKAAGALKHMNLVKALLVLTGKPTYAGIGLLTPGTQSWQVAWEDLRGADFDPQALKVTLHTRDEDDGAEPLTVLCTPENFAAVREWVAGRGRG
jgi:hypothetical protein